jgi:glycosyltransferase involved in cell wall biosynthesis
VPQLAGESGGAAEAVDDGVTGLVVKRPDNVDDVASALRELLSSEDRRRAMGRASRERAIAEFDYGVLSRRLGEVLGVGK